MTLNNTAATPATGARDEAGCLELIKEIIGRNCGAKPDQIDPDQPLSAIPGIESVKALRAITEVEDACEVVIPDDFLFETATVREMAAFVARLAGGAA